MTLPPVPPGLDYRLEYFLTQIRSELSSLNKKTGDTGTTSETGVFDSSPSSFTLTADTATLLVDQSTGTENAYTTISAGAPADARYAELLIIVNSTDNADDGDMKLKGAEGIATPILAECVAGAADARVMVTKIISLNSAGEFQYQFTNTSATTIDWSIYYMGYVQ